MTIFTPKEMSELTGLSIPTLHYYEEIGLLDEVSRASNGHRRYTEENLIRVEFVMHVRATGMSIRQIQEFVDLHRAGNQTRDERLEILENHRAVVQGQIDSLQKTMDFLNTKIEIVRDLGSHEHKAEAMLAQAELTRKGKHTNGHSNNSHYRK